MPPHKYGVPPQKSIGWRAIVANALPPSDITAPEAIGVRIQLERAVRKRQSHPLVSPMGRAHQGDGHFRASGGSRRRCYTAQCRPDGRVSSALSYK